MHAFKPVLTFIAVGQVLESSSPTYHEKGASAEGSGCGPGRGLGSPGTTSHLAGQNGPCLARGPAPKSAPKTRLSVGSMADFHVPSTSQGNPRVLRPASSLESCPRRQKPWRLGWHSPASWPRGHRVLSALPTPLPQRKVQTPLSVKTEAGRAQPVANTRPFLSSSSRVTLDHIHLNDSIASFSDLSSFSNHLSPPKRNS